jgi:hypothetical protein
MRRSCFRALKSATCLLTKSTNCSGLMQNSLTKTHVIAGTRNVWSVAKFRQPLPTVEQINSSTWRGWNTISACYNHSDGDKELAEFLKDEIKVEKESSPKPHRLPKIKDFVVEKTDGPKVTLTKKLGNETITVKFNVNNTIEESLMNMQENEGLNQTEEESPPVASRPAFVVEISKAGHKTLAIQCTYNQEEPPAQDGQEEPYPEPVEIQELALLNTSQEWSDDVYILSGGIMDGNLYGLMMNYLEDRGIDGEFLIQLVDFSTSYEHKKYVGLLEDLKVFVESK